MTTLRKSLLYFALALAFFSLFRLGLFVYYRDYFSQLSAVQILGAFAHGVRFDAAIIALFFAVPLLLMNLPLRVVANRRWQLFLAWTLWAMAVLMGVVLAADVVYFGFVDRHIAAELLAVGQDMGAVLRVAFTGYGAALAAYAVLCAALAALWRRIAVRPTVLPRAAPIVFVGLLFALVLTARGWTFHGKPINVVHAFASGSTATGNLTLNGVFSAVLAADASRAVERKFFSPQEARRIFAEDYPLTDSPYPLLRHYEPKKAHPNLVLVLLESWSFRYIDALAGSRYGVTPNFDALVKQGLRFTRAYSVGQRSIDGVQATLTGIPPLIGMPYLGKGLEVSNISRLGAIAARNGYRTIFVQSSRRGSFRMDAIAQAAGFEEYYGMEDIPLVFNYPDPDAAAFGWDYDTFMFLSGKLARTKEPFLAYVYTGTTHEPFARLPARFEKRSYDGPGEGRFLDTLYYADWSLGEFMKSAAKADWFKNTVFIFVADHPIGKFNVQSVIDRHHIPLLIYAPRLIKPETKDTIASQLDLFPTVMDLLGFDDAFSALGESLLRKKDGNALVVAGNTVGLIGKDGCLMHTLKNRLDACAVGQRQQTPAYLDALERKLLATDQVVYELLNANRWAPP